MDQPWGTILPGLADPIVGEPSDYEAARQAAQTLHDSSQACADEFSNIKAGDSEICGDAANKLVEVIKQVDSTFQELPGIFHSLSMIFGDHETKLQDLRQKAAEALARANTHWTDLKTAETKREAAATRLRNVGNRMDEAASAPATDPNAASRLRELEQKHDRASGDLQKAQRQIEAQKAALDGSRTEHAGLVTSEADLVTQTCTKLRNLDLGCLQDPHRLVELFHDAVDWAHDLGDKIVKALVDLVNYWMPGFLDLLWRLSGLLDILSKILDGITIVLALLTLIPVLSPFIAPVLGVVSNIALAVKGIKLVIDLILLISGHPNPETGEKMTLKQVIVEGVTMAISVGVSKYLMSSASSLTTKAMTGPLGEVDELTGLARPIPGTAVNFDKWMAIQGHLNWAAKVYETGVETALSDGVSFAADHASWPGVGALNVDLQNLFMDGVHQTKVWGTSAAAVGKAIVPSPSEALKKIEESWVSIAKVTAVGPISDPLIASFQLVGAK